MQIGGVCKCDTAEGPSSAGLALLLAGLALAAARRRSQAPAVGRRKLRREPDQIS
jgi:MYXO-CTERM domain-containing protein